MAGDKKQQSKGMDLDLTADPKYDDAQYRDVHSLRDGETVPLRDGVEIRSRVLVPVGIVLGAAAFLHFVLGMVGLTSVWVSLVVVAVLQLVATIDDPRNAAKLLHKVFKKIR